MVRRLGSGNGPSRGGFPFGEELREVQAWRQPETRAYRDYLADFRADFHHIRYDPRFRSCLNPNSYQEPQLLAHDLLIRGSAGVVYPSVRHPGGTCIGCFRPALVTNVREGGLTSISFANAQSQPVIETAEKL